MYLLKNLYPTKKYPYINLGNKLRELRGGLNQESYAKQLGVALRTYHRYEKGERKIPDGLLKLATLLNRNNTKIGYVSEPKSEYRSQEQELINMAKQILRSEYGLALAANIRAFHSAIQKDKERGKLKKQITDLRKEIADLGERLSDINSDLAHHTHAGIKR